MFGLCDAIFQKMLVWELQVKSKEFFNLVIIYVCQIESTVLYRNFQFRNNWQKLKRILNVVIKGGGGDNP